MERLILIASALCFVALSDIPYGLIWALNIVGVVELVNLGGKIIALLREPDEQEQEEVQS